MTSADPPIETAPAAVSEGPSTSPRARAGTAFGGVRRAIGTIAGVLFVASLVKELRTPKEQRTWHGTVLGFVPYDLRLPTPARFREVYWNPESHRLMGGRVFGVGWTLNLYEVVARVRGLLGRAPAPASA